MTTSLPFDGQCHRAVAGSVESHLSHGNRVGQNVDVEVLLVRGAEGRHREADHRQHQVELKR